MSEKMETGVHRQDQAAGGASPFATSRRIAAGTMFRAVGEIVAKLATLAFVIAIARELGESKFGDFIFGISLSGVVLTFADFGTGELTMREVSRDRERVHSMFANLLVVKSVLLIGLWIVIGAIVTVGGYPDATKVAVLVIAIGTGMEALSNTNFAVFQAFERMQYVAITLIVQRTLTAAVGIGVLVGGGSLIAAAAVFAVGAAIGFLAGLTLMRRFVVRPRMSVDRARWAPLLRAGLPFGMVTLLYLALIRLDATMISFLTDTDNEAVGHYGAAYRLVDATMFLSWAFAGAVLPWISRHDLGGGPVPLAKGYELGLKVVVATLLPIALIYGLFASELIETLYGSAYDDAVTPLRLLAAMTVLFGLNTYLAVVLIGRNRPREFTMPAIAVIVQNVAFNFVLIPEYGASGAAANAVLSGALLFSMVAWRTRRVGGSVSPGRIVAAPLIGGGAMVAIILAAGGLPWPIAATLSLIAYALVAVAIERYAHADDFAIYVGVLRRGPA